MVPADSDGIPLVPPYSGYCASSLIGAYRTFTPYSLPFQVIRLDIDFEMQSYNPEAARNFGLGSSPFARHY